MAILTFSTSLPTGYRLQDMFSAIIVPTVFDTTQTVATFVTDVDHNRVAGTFFGSQLSASSGFVAGFSYSFGGRVWIEYGNAAALPYQDFNLLQTGGATTAAAFMAGDDSVTGSSRGDFLDTYDGSDTLDGSGGEDTMAGGLGNDLYRVDEKDDRVIENRNAGYDTVIASVNYALGKSSEVEVLQAIAGRKALSLTGNEFANLVLGNDGNNILDGSGGADTMIGGFGNDTYIVDNKADVIVELAGRGRDTILSSVSYRMGDDTFVEALGARGKSSISLVGNAFANTITGNTGHNLLKGMSGNDVIYGDGGSDKLYGGFGNDKLYGGMGSDKLYGDAGNDFLYGDVGNDVLSGGDGQDKLYGGMGDDVLRGGAGNDVLYGDVGNDRLYGDAGNDKLYGGPGNNILSGGAGNDTLYGSYDNDLLKGDAGNDRLFGDGGNDTLSGGAGRDVLSGGEGYDTFVFDAKLNARTNVDTIIDFNPWTDRINLKSGIFAGIGSFGPLNDDAFWVGATAHDASDRIIYDRPSGSLYYDPDGAGAKEKVKFAVVSGNIELTKGAFWIV